MSVRRVLTAFSDLVPSASLRILAQARQLLVGSSLTGLGLLGFTPGSPALNGLETGSPAPSPVAITSAERHRKPSRLVLTLRQAVSSVVTIGHTSHRSHSSHSSHVSGGGGSGGARTAPPVYLATSPTPTPAPVRAEANEIAVTLVSVDKARRSFAATDDFGTRFEFDYRDDTEVQGQLGFVRLDEYLETASEVPFQAGKKARVSWKPSTDKRKRLATRVVPLDQ
jgi:hypothetical protein